MSSRKWQRQWLNFVKENGVHDARLDPSGKHVKIIGTLNGKPFWTLVPHTQSTSRRAFVQTRVTIRHAIRACLHQEQ